MADDIKTIVTQRASDGVESSYASTPGVASPNYFVTALSPLRVIATRVARVYLQSVTGIVSAGMSGADGGMLPDDFAGLVITAARMSVAIAGITALQNTAEILARLDQKAPEWRA